jgi:mono/diheme cytochrome c family protein
LRALAMFARASLGMTIVLCFLSGCRQDMHNQPKFIPLRASDFFPDGRSARPLVPGTVDRSEVNEDPAYLTGLENSRPVLTLPFPVTRTLLERGRERFNIYCTPCHGELGDGNGMVAQRGYLHPPSLHDERLRQAPVGHFFDVITNGLGGMPDYAQQIPVDDRWKIIAYIRALQLSQHAAPSDVPADIRSRLGEPLPPVSTGITGETGVRGMAPPSGRQLPPATGVPEKGKEQP